MSEGLVPAFKHAVVNATVLKWFTDIGADDQACIRYVSVLVTTAEAADTLTFSDEDGSNVFAIVPLTAVGLFTFIYPDETIFMPVGHDIKVVHSGTSGVANVCIAIGKFV